MELEESAKVAAASYIYDYKNSWCVLDGVDPTSSKEIAEYRKRNENDRDRYRILMTLLLFSSAHSRYLFGHSLLTSPTFAMARWSDSSSKLVRIPWVLKSLSIVVMS